MGVYCNNTSIWFGTASCFLPIETAKNISLCGNKNMKQVKMMNQRKLEYRAYKKQHEWRSKSVMNTEMKN